MKLKERNVMSLRMLPWLTVLHTGQRLVAWQPQRCICTVSPTRYDASHSSLMALIPCCGGVLRLGEKLGFSGLHLSDFITFHCSHTCFGSTREGNHWPPTLFSPVTGSLSSGRGCWLGLQPFSTVRTLWKGAYTASCRVKQC